MKITKIFVICLGLVLIYLGRLALLDGELISAGASFLMALTIAAGYSGLEESDELTHILDSTSGGKK